MTPTAQSARLEFSPARAEVGQAVVARVIVEHAPNARVELAGFGDDDSWVRFAELPGARESLANGTTRSTFECELGSLEPGARSLDGLAVQVDGRKLEVERASLEVVSLLGETEDAPRPLRDRGEVQWQDAGANLWPWILLALALVGGVALIVRRLRAAQPPKAAAPRAASRLAEWSSRTLETPDAVREAHVELTRWLRVAVDRRDGVDRRALSDEEWLAVARAPDREDQAAIERLLAESGAVKYGPERPTHWATRERLELAGAIAGRVEPAQEVRR